MMRKTNKISNGVKNKIIFIVIDGLGDRKIKALGNKTPLEAAKTPSLDFLAKNGIQGFLKPVFQGAIPTSEEGHFSLFGYDPRIYQIKRGFFTAIGAGMRMKRGDIALRGNFGTIDSEFNIIDRRAGRIEKIQPLVNSISRIVIDNVKFLIKPAGGHRLAIVMRGKNLSSNISDGDPHYAKLGNRAEKIRPLDKNSRSLFTARVLNEFLEKTRYILSSHPLNKKREKQGLYPANYVLVRGASSPVKLPEFKTKYRLRACCIAGKLLYKQIGKSLGMDIIEVRGADGSLATNLKGKFLAAEKAVKKYDFVFLHIKAVDSFGEDGNYLAKKMFLEKIDKNLKPLFGLKNTTIALTGDHSTCSELKRHCKELVPIFIFGKGKGRIGKISQLAVMKNVLL